MSESLDPTDELIAERRADPTGRMPPDMPRWMARTIVGIDRFSLWVGRLICWLTLPLLGAMVFEIVMRYAFVAPTLWAYDISRMLSGALFMLGAGYALSKGVHIRADFIYRSLGVRTQGLIDATLYVVFYFPGLILFLLVGIDFAEVSWLRGERGMDTSWMPRVAPIKSALPAGVALLLVQGVSELLKCLYAARRGRWPG